MPDLFIFNFFWELKHEYIIFTSFISTLSLPLPAPPLYSFWFSQPSLLYLLFYTPTPHTEYCSCVRVFRADPLGLYSPVGTHLWKKLILPWSAARIFYIFTNPWCFPLFRCWYTVLVLWSSTVFWGLICTSLRLMVLSFFSCTYWQHLYVVLADFLLL